MKTVNKTIPLKPVVSLAPMMKQGELVAFNMGADGIVYFVFAQRPLNYRRFLPKGPSFALTRTGSLQSYRVVGFFDSELVCDVQIENEPYNIHEIQPVGNLLLLACARSHYRGPHNYERNGRFYRRDGVFSHEILLGDGINTIQATANCEIWTSYFDEGVFGNYGWNDPVGASGLVTWNANGGKLYEFTPGQGLDQICDCYAMNAEADESVWIYYYTDFPLVHLHRRKIVGIWYPSEGGSKAFAVSGHHVLFSGGYDDRNSCSLLSLETNGQTNVIAHVRFQGQNGENLKAQRCVGRGDKLYLLCGDLLYCTDVWSTLNW